VLAAIAELLPLSGDVGGRAGRILSKSAIAERSGLSRHAVYLAVHHWLTWRVLWIRRRGKGVLEVRLERRVVEELLHMRATDPRKVGALLKEHREKLAEQAAVA